MFDDSINYFRRNSQMQQTSESLRGFGALRRGIPARDSEEVLHMLEIIHCGRKGVWMYEESVCQLGLPAGFQYMHTRQARREKSKTSNQYTNICCHTEADTTSCACRMVVGNAVRNTNHNNLTQCIPVAVTPPRQHLKQRHRFEKRHDQGW